MKILNLFICFFTLGTTSLCGQILVDTLQSHLLLTHTPEVQILLTDQKTSFQEAKKSSQWAQYNAVHFSNEVAAIWLKFELENTSNDTIRTYLYSTQPRICLYKQSGQRVERLENGLYVPRSENELNDNLFTKVSISPHQSSIIYLRMIMNGSMAAPSDIKLYSENAYLNHVAKRHQEQEKPIAFIYFYIISLFTIFIFALVFWLRLTEKLYLYYLGYLLFQIVYGFLVLRYTTANLGNFFETVPKLAFDVFEPVQFCFIGFYILFICQLLQIENYDKLLKTILNYLAMACFIYAVSSFTFNQMYPDFSEMATIFFIVRSIILPLNFILIFWIIYKVKHPLLIYFIVGQSFFFGGALLSTYVAYSDIWTFSHSFFNYKLVPNVIFQIGLLAEVYCFSLALGKNVFLLQKEKEQAHTKLIHQLQENQHLQETMNRELDAKVQKKTSELIALYSEIERERDQKIKDDFNKRIKETEMMALRSQMNPHFIFNSMTAIKNLIMSSRNEDAIAYLDDFSSLLRGILQNSNRKKISVEEELEILELYLSLEKNRMGADFKYTIHADSKEELSQYQIPPLLLQPMVENAIWHGLHPSLKAEKRLSITFDTTADLKIIIEDNGIGRKESAKKKKLHHSMGTGIVQDRLTLYNYLSDHVIHLKIEDLEDHERVLGTRITLTYKY